jgi:hypothetical protein
MAKGKKHTAEQIVNLLRQVEVGVANGNVSCAQGVTTAGKGVHSDLLTSSISTTKRQLNFFPIAPASTRSDWDVRPYLPITLPTSAGFALIRKVVR